MLFESVNITVLVADQTFPPLVDEFNLKISDRAEEDHRLVVQVSTQHQLERIKLTLGLSSDMARTYSRQSPREVEGFLADTWRFDFRPLDKLANNLRDSDLSDFKFEIVIFVLQDSRPEDENMLKTDLFVAHIAEQMPLLSARGFLVVNIVADLVLVKKRPR